MIQRSKELRQSEPKLINEPEADISTSAQVLPSLHVT
jgi:hypothetical protein